MMYRLCHPHGEEFLNSSAIRRQLNLTYGKTLSCMLKLKWNTEFMIWGDLQVFCFIFILLHFGKSCLLVACMQTELEQSHFDIFVAGRHFLRLWLLQ